MYTSTEHSYRVSQNTFKSKRAQKIVSTHDHFQNPVNLVPRAHVPFGQHQDTELWNNQFPETKILGLPASRRMRGLVYMASRDKVDVDTFHKGIQLLVFSVTPSKIDQNKR